MSGEEGKSSTRKTPTPNYASPYTAAPIPPLLPKLGLYIEWLAAWKESAQEGLHVQKKHHRAKLKQASVRPMPSPGYRLYSASAAGRGPPVNKTPAQEHRQRAGGCGPSLWLKYILLLSLRIQTEPWDHVHFHSRSSVREIPLSPFLPP